MATAGCDTTLICPLEHESGVLGTGPSLEYRLWGMLAERVNPPTALELGNELGLEDVTGLQGSAATSVVDVQKALERSKYFTQVDDGRWVLSIHKKLRWGVAGCGKIAADFISVLSLIPGAQLTAVATSSDQPRAQVFADRHGAARGYGSYQELADDSEVHVVYVATIHTGHVATALQMIAAGKHVLVEKPMCMNAAEVEQLVAAATEKGLFLMEGMWSRFLPAEQAVRQLIHSGQIGHVLMANAQFTFLADEGVERLMKAELGGGAMLDIGIYPLALMCFMFGNPEKVISSTETVGHESDMAGSAVMRFHNVDKTVTMSSVQWSFRLDTPRLATFQGTGGQISMSPLQCPDTLTITHAGQEAQTFTFPHPRVASASHGPSQGFNFSGSAGFVYEAMAVHSAIINGMKEMDDMPLADSLTLARIMDTIVRDNTLPQGI